MLENVCSRVARLAWQTFSTAGILTIEQRNSKSNSLQWILFTSILITHIVVVAIVALGLQFYSYSICDCSHTTASERLRIADQLLNHCFYSVPLRLKLISLFSFRSLESKSCNRISYTYAVSQTALSTSNRKTQIPHPLACQRIAQFIRRYSASKWLAYMLARVSIVSQSHVQSFAVTSVNGMNFIQWNFTKNRTKPISTREGFKSVWDLLAVCLGFGNVCYWTYFVALFDKHCLVNSVCDS